MSSLYFPIHRKMNRMMKVEMIRYNMTANDAKLSWALNFRWSGYQNLRIAYLRSEARNENVHLSKFVRYQTTSRWKKQTRTRRYTKLHQTAEKIMHPDHSQTVMRNAHPTTVASQPSGIRKLVSA